MPEDIKNMVLGLVTEGNSSLAKEFQGFTKEQLEVFVRFLGYSHKQCLANSHIEWLAQRIHYLANLHSTAPKVMEALKTDVDVLSTVDSLMSYTDVDEDSIRTIVVSKDEQENLHDIVKCLKTTNEGVQILLIISK